MNKNLLCLSFVFTMMFSGAQVNLTANLKLCMPCTGNANDLSGNNNNGIVTNATLTADRFGNPNSAYSFGTGTSNINIGNLSIYAPTNELTVSMWGKSKVYTSTCLFEVLNDTPHDRFVGCAQYANAGSTMMIWDYGSIYSGGRTTATGIPQDQLNWHHYVYIVSQSGNVKQMYLDGNQVSNAPFVHVVAFKNKPIWIGAHQDTTGGSLRWLGDIDDITIYNRALNQSEVTALFTSTTMCAWGGGAGVSELPTFHNFQLYPTVSNEGKYSIYNDVKNFNVEVYTIDGKLIGSFTSSDVAPFTEIDISKSESGVYFIKVHDGRSSYTTKVIKN